MLYAIASSPFLETNDQAITSVVIMRITPYNGLFPTLVQVIGSYRTVSHQQNDQGDGSNYQAQTPRCSLRFDAIVWWNALF